MKDTGLRNPFAGYAQNRIWVEVVALVADLLTWMRALAFDEHNPARNWEPKKLRFRLLAVASRIIRTRPTKTTATPNRAAVESPHRLLLGRAPHHLNHPIPSARAGTGELAIPAPANNHAHNCDRRPPVFRRSTMCPDEHRGYLTRGPAMSRATLREGVVGADRCAP